MPGKGIALEHSYISTNKELVSLGGHGVSAKEAVTKGTPQRIDIGWIKLQPKVAKLLKASRTFLEIGNIDVRDAPQPKSRYVVLGYRGFESKLAEKITVDEVTQIFYLSTPTHESTYKRGKFPPRDFMLTHFNRKKTYLLIRRHVEPPPFQAASAVVHYSPVLSFSMVKNIM